MITYLFEDGIFNVKFENEVSLEELISFIEEFKKIEYLPNKLLVLLDFEKAFPKFNPSETKSISLASELSTQKFTHIKTALLANNPIINAYSTLFALHSEEKKRERKIFSTKEAALKWLVM